MKFVRPLSALSAVVLTAGLYVAATPSEAEAAGCGFLGLEACAPPPPAPDGSAGGNTPLPPATACGAPIRATQNRNWRCTFADQFGGSTLDRKKWLVQTNWQTGNHQGMWACYVDSPRNVWLSSSTLHLVVRKNSTPTTCPSVGQTNYTSGMVTTYRLFSQQYGRFQVRMRVKNTAVAGLQDVFWLWPDDRYTAMNWPTTGEIDVNEQYSFRPKLSIPYLHYTANDHGGAKIGVNTARNCYTKRGAWNVYTLTWTPKKIIIQVNGKTCLANYQGASDTAFQRRYIINLTEALGEAANSASSRTPLPATMDVDYVRVWK